MKKKLPILYKVFTLLVLATLFISFSGSPPSGLTGAPGDGTCNNCHFGGTQTGTVDIQGITDNPIVANQTYNVSIVINLASGTSPRAGFQFVALDGNGAGSSSTGSFSNFGTNVGTSTSGSRTYAQHSGGENTYVGSNVTYTFDWTAPATSTNDISFYAVGNIADGSGTGGDLIVFDSDQNIPLPVELTSFSLEDSGNGQTQINWSTASENNSAYFEIMRGESGRDFFPLTQVDAAGFSDHVTDYSFLDEQPILNRNSFYRLKQVDLDGGITYSEVKVVRVMDYKDHHLNIFPNPAQNNACLFIDYISETQHQEAIIRIFDIHGSSVFEDPQMYSGIKKGFNKFVLDIKDFAPGQYFLSIFDQGHLLETKPFIVGN